jgi:hypothetical protein
MSMTATLWFNVRTGPIGFFDFMIVSVLAGTFFRAMKDQYKIEDEMDVVASKKD